MISVVSSVFLQYMLKYDTVHGRFPGVVTHDENGIIVAGENVKARPAPCGWVVLTAVTARLITLNADDPRVLTDFR